jgi:hypothetical protein
MDRSGSADRQRGVPMTTGFLRSADRPSGWPLATLLRQIRLELESRTVALSPDDPTRARNLQIAGHLLVAEGVETAPGRQLELVAGGDRPRVASRPLHDR